MQFFKHHTNMRYDVKIRRLMKRYGIEGYGLYNLIIETIAERLSSDTPVPSLEETAQDIAEQYGNDTAKINDMMAFMLTQGLFELDEITGRILCHKLYRFIDKSQTRSPEIRNMIEVYKTSLCPRQLKTIPDKPDRREENRIDIEEKEKRRFAPPSPQEVQAYLDERGIVAFTGIKFCNSYEAKGWMIGKTKMKNWKAAVNTWVDREKNSAGNTYEKDKKKFYGNNHLL